MPLYEFECEKCGKQSELLVRSSDWKGTACPHCNSKRLKKKLSVFAATGPSESDPGPQCTGQPGSCGRCALD